MIWPFRKKAPKQTREEYAAAQPPMHWLWRSCPACAAIREAKRKDDDMNALADKIAARLRQTPDGVSPNDHQTEAPSNTHGS